MAKQDYTIDFTTGSGTKSLPVGTYTYVSNTIPGYTGGSVETFTITPTTTSVSVSISAAGVLTVNVVDDINEPITEGSLQLSDSTGDTRYGTVQTISKEGVATFNNVPYIADTGVNFHLAQDSTDASHIAITDPQAVSMQAATQTESITNQRITVSPTFTISDPNFTGLTPLTGGLTVNG